MNPSEINNAITVLVMFLAPIAAKYGIESSDLSTIVGGLVSAGAAAWGLYSHWNMKKVPEAAVVIPTKIGAGK